MKSIVSPSPQLNLPQQARHPFEPVASFAQAVLELLYPPMCAHCGRVDTYWCDSCHQQMMANPLYHQVNFSLAPLTALTTTSVHQGVLQKMIHVLKYENTPQLAAPLAERLYSAVATLGWPLDAVAGVPMYPPRQRARGYNQAERLAHHLAKRLNVPHVSYALHRERFQRPQVGLTAQERQENVAESFRADDSVNHLRLLLVDDVLTTGATLAACASAIFESGAVAVYGVTLTAAALKQ